MINLQVASSGAHDRREKSKDWAAVGRRICGGNHLRHRQTQEPRCVCDSPCQSRGGMITSATFCFSCFLCWWKIQMRTVFFWNLQRLRCHGLLRWRLYLKTFRLVRSSLNPTLPGSLNPELKRNKDTFRFCLACVQRVSESRCAIEHAWSLIEGGCMQKML